MWIAAASFVLALSQTPAKVDRSGEGYLVQLLEKYAKLPSFYLWYDRYSGDGQTPGYDKGGTVQLWYGGGKQFRISSCGSFGDDVLGVSDGKTLMVDRMDLGRAVELSAMPPAWQGLSETMAPNQSGCLVLSLLDGPDSLDKLAEKDKPVTMVRDGGKFVVTFTNKAMGEVKLEIVDGWLVADEFVERIEFDGQKFDFVTRDEYKPFVYAPKLPKGVFNTTPAKGLMVDDLRKKAERKPPRR